MFAEDNATGLTRRLCIDGEWERAFEVEIALNPRARRKAQRLHFGEGAVAQFLKAEIRETELCRA
jgi:hypothetical protein